MAVQRRSWQRIWWRSAARFGEDNKFKPNSIGSGFINWAEWPGETDPCGYKCNSWPWVEEDTMTNLVNNKEEVIVKKGRLPAAQTAVVIISSQTAVMIISKRISPRHNRQQERSCIVMSSGTVLCLQASCGMFCFRGGVVCLSLKFYSTHMALNHWFTGICYDRSIRALFADHAFLSSSLITS